MADSIQVTPTWLQMHLQKNSVTDLTQSQPETSSNHSQQLPDGHCVYEAKELETIYVKAMSNSPHCYSYFVLTDLELRTLHYWHALV